MNSTTSRHETARVFMTSKTGRRDWFAEDDVVYTGDEGDFMRQFEGDRSDLLCSHLSGDGDVPNWSWRATFNAPAATLRGSDQVTLISRGFFPMYRISALAFLKVLDDQRTGRTGLCEAQVPTILKNTGDSVTDLNHGSPLLVYTAGAMRQSEGPRRLSGLRSRPPVPTEESESTIGPLFHHSEKLDFDETAKSVAPAR